MITIAVRMFRFAVIVMSDLKVLTLRSSIEKCVNHLIYVRIFNINILLNILPTSRLIYYLKMCDFQRRVFNVKTLRVEN